MDINFDDLDGTSKAPATKPGKFAPKNSKFKPVAKPKHEPEAPLTSGSNPVAIPKAELDDSNPAASVYSKTEIEQPLHGVPTSHDDMKIDTDVTEMEVDNQQKPDDKDHLVREIDVFFTSSAVDADSKLYVLQYPLRPCWRPYELEERCEKVRVNPGNSKIEVEMSVQVDSENYDADADDDKAMRKQVLSCKWKPPPATIYAVGILMGNELHLNPVHAVVQLRPSIKDPEVGHPSKKMNTTRDEDMIASTDIKTEKSIKQSKKQSKLPGAVTEENEDAKEKWIPLKYHGATSELSQACIGKMVARQVSPIQFPMSPYDYIDSLCPAIASDKLRPKGPSRSSLLKLPLEERYSTWLIEGPPVHRFNSLKHIAPNESDEDIFRVLQEHAQLVQGLWVAKSKLKYGKDVGREVLLRNYVLLQFSKNPIFHEVQLPKSTSVSDTIKTILDEFAARRDSCRDWKFKEHPDGAFIKQYPNVVEEQKRNWDLMEPQIINFLFPNMSKPVISSTNAVVPRTTNVPPSRPPVPDETREALPKAIQKIFQAYKVCSLNQIRQKLRDAAVSENTTPKGSREARAAVAAADTREELLKILDQVAVNIHGVFVPRSSPEFPQYDELRNIVINLFLAEGPNAKLKKAMINAAATNKLKREITSVEYQKVLTELCVSQNSAWVLKSGDGTPP